MGGHHAASGAAAWVAIASTGPYTLGWYPLDATGILIGGRDLQDAEILEWANSVIRNIFSDAPLAVG